MVFTQVDIWHTALLYNRASQNYLQQKASIWWLNASSIKTDLGKPTGVILICFFRFFFFQLWNLEVSMWTSPPNTYSGTIKNLLYISYTYYLQLLLSATFFYLHNIIKIKFRIRFIVTLMGNMYKTKLTLNESWNIYCTLIEELYFIMVVLNVFIIMVGLQNTT